MARPLTLALSGTNYGHKHPGAPGSRVPDLKFRYPTHTQSVNYEV